MTDSSKILYLSHTHMKFSTKMAAFYGMHMLWNIAMCDFQIKCAGQSDPNVPLCFTGDQKKIHIKLKWLKYCIDGKSYPYLFYYFIYSNTKQLFSAFSNTKKSS